MLKLVAARILNKARRSLHERNGLAATFISSPSVLLAVEHLFTQSDQPNAKF